MELNRLLNKLGRIYPRKLQEFYDNCGYQFGRKNKEIKRIALCLDFSLDVYESLKDKDVDLVISHHPYIFGGTLRQVRKKDEIKNEVIEKVINDNRYALYSFHTCFDNAYKDGMNDAIGERLGLDNLRGSSLVKGIRIGELKEEMSLEDLASYVKEKLCLSYVLMCKGNSKKVKTVAFVGGAGSSFYRCAIEEKADVLISSDIAHHTRRDILNRGFNYLEIAHEVERIFMEKISEELKKISNEFEIIIIDDEKEMLAL